MAEADPLLDEYLTDEDRRLADQVGADVPQSGLGPAPGNLDEIAPASPVAIPVEGPQELPGLPVEGPGAPPPADAAEVQREALPPDPTAPTGQAARDANAKEAEAIAKQQGEQDTARAKIEAETANQMAQAAKEADQEAALTQADYLQRRQQAEGELDARVKAYESTKLTDPRENTNGLKATLAVIFGGLGAAFRSAGGGSSNNDAVDVLMKRWDDDTAIQKANIAALRDQSVMARTRVADIDEGRRRMQRDADARLVAKYNTALKQGEAQLKNQGVPQAQIDADKRMLQLKEGRMKAEVQARKDEDAHALAQAHAAALLRGRATSTDSAAKTRLMNARAELLEKKAKGGGKGGGAAHAEVGAEVAQYLIDHPGDTPGARRLAAGRVDGKEFDKIVNQTKSTESQNKGAEFGQAGIRAVGALEKSKYVPTDADTQRWLNNQRDVYQAREAGGGGGISGLLGAKAAGGLQSLGMMAKSEVDGLSPDGQLYFANVRRLMEPLGRAKSGAAISQGEWVNFFNQYGPQSSGGYAAARKDLEDSLKLSGVAGRSISGGSAATPTAGGGAPSKFVPGTTMKLKSGKTVRITDTDGSYETVSDGRR